MEPGKAAPSGEDSTRREQATPGEITEQAKRESTQWFRLIVEASPQAIIVADRAGRITLVNTHAEKLFGYRREELLGQLVEKLVPERFHTSHVRDREAFAATPSTRPMGAGRDLFGLRKDGTVVPIEIGLNPFREGDVSFVLASIVDITERKRAEAQHREFDAKLQQAQKLESLGVLAGGIAHDFNNLLTGIVGHADLALLALPPDSQVREHLEQIQMASHRAADLCRQMLAYAGKGRFVIGPLDLNQVIQEMASLLEVAISKKAVLKCNRASGLPLIEADATQIRQVIMNLITNASEALGDRSGVIILRTGAMLCDEAYLRDTYGAEGLAARLYVFLEVSDTGHGMDEETRRKIFDPFFSTKFTGRGLGLSAVLGIVRAHKGAIRVYSEPGRGTLFRILLPAHEKAAAPQGAQPATSSTAQAAGTILLVDDEENIRTVTKVMLEKVGFRVLTASNGREATDVFRLHADEIACVLLDLTMPQMGGEEAFRELQRAKSGVRVVLCSGYSEQDALNRFGGEGLAGFVQKPYRMAEVVGAIRRAMGAG